MGCIIPTALGYDRRPISTCNGFDDFRLFREAVPGIATGIDDVIVSLEDPV
jgi:hypothetical protein